MGQIERGGGDAANPLGASRRHSRDLQGANRHLAGCSEAPGRRCNRLTCPAVTYKFTGRPWLLQMACSLVFTLPLVRSIRRPRPPFVG